MSEHNPLPWRVARYEGEDIFDVLDATDESVLTWPGYEEAGFTDGTARLIVEAVNAHQMLIGECADLRARLAEAEADIRRLCVQLERARLLQARREEEEDVAVHEEG